MKTSDYLDAARTKLGLPSDYALAKHLGITREYVSQFRLAKRPLSDEVAIKIADILGKDRLELLAVSNLERAKTPEAEAVWAGLLQKISQGFLSLSLLAKSGRRLALPR